MAPKRGITESAYKAAAADLGVDVPTIKAVAEVESAGSGYLSSGRVKILFEGHVFHKLTKGKYSKAHPEISYAKWTKRFYIGGEGEYARFNEAFSLDPEAAMKSASWGRFQIMGFNFKPAGFKTVGAFVDAMKESEDRHLQAFVDYVQAEGIDDELQSQNWDAFALRYNGPSYKRNNYGVRLRRSYAKYLRDTKAAPDPSAEHASELFSVDAADETISNDISDLDSATPTPADLPTESPNLVQSGTVSPVDGPPAKLGEPVPDVAATEGQAIVGGRPGDPTKQATTDGFKSRVYAALAGIPAFFAAVKGFIDGNTALVIFGMGCVTIVVLALIFRSFILDYLRMRFMSDPAKYNVK